MPSLKPIEITIDDLAFGGDGVGRVDGKACFVPDTIPGETCLVRPVQEKKSFVRAELLEVIEPSPDRVTPSCSVYGRCGGCQYQHLSYEAELRWKQQQVTEIFARLGGLPDPPIKSIIPSPDPYGYRNRIQIHLERGRPGFKGRDGRSHVPIDQCPIAHPQINQQLADWKQGAGGKREERVTLVSPEILHGGFSQVNGLLAEALKQLVTGAVETFRAGELIEFYAGAGFFTEPLANCHQTVTAIEWDRRLVARGRQALPSARWLEMDVDEAITHLREQEIGPGTVVLVDPPREGLSGRLKEWLGTIDAAGLVYLSCNPATQARDFKELSERWRVESIQPIDLFPQTAHIESLVRLLPNVGGV